MECRLSESFILRTLLKFTASDTSWVRLLGSVFESGLEWGFRSDFGKLVNYKRVSSDLRKHFCT